MTQSDKGSEEKTATQLTKLRIDVSLLRAHHSEFNYKL